MWQVFTNGSLQKISDGNWRGTSCIGSYNRRLFAVWKTGLYEVHKNASVLFGAGYATASTLVQNGRYLYTTIGSSQCGRLYRIDIDIKSATKTRWGSIGIYPLGLTHIYNEEYLIGADENWTLISKKGDGVTLAPGNATAVTSSPNGLVYAINSAGDVDIIDASTGNVHTQLTTGELFTGSRSLVWFQNALYAIGKNRKFYKINIITGEVSIQGTTTDWDCVFGHMTAIN